MTRPRKLRSRASQGRPDTRLACRLESLEKKYDERFALIFRALDQITRRRRARART